MSKIPLSCMQTYGLSWTDSYSKRLCLSAAFTPRLFVEMIIKTILTVSNKSKLTKVISYTGSVQKLSNIGWVPDLKLFIVECFKCDLDMFRPVGSNICTKSPLFISVRAIASSQFDTVCVFTLLSLLCCLSSSCQSESKLMFYRLSHIMHSHKKRIQVIWVL